MVTTRHKLAVSYMYSTDDEMGVDGFVYVDDSDEDVKPKRKKAKTTSKRTKRKGKVTARSLMKDLFSALPLDLIYEVFGQLHPLDLLNLARTSKMLRHHLMSKRSVSVWKTAREAIIPPVPECPKDQSEPQWATLLFMLNCTMCGTPRIQTVDWSLRLRGCDTCFKKNIIHSRTALRTYRHIEDLNIVLDLIPWSGTGAWTYRSSLGHKFYYSPHIEEMGEIVEDFQRRIDAGVKGVREEFDKFMERMKAKAAEQVESEEALKEWARNAARLRSLQNTQLMEERKQAMIAKLIELGHDTRDVQEAADTWSHHGRYIFIVQRR